MTHVNLTEWNKWSVKCIKNYLKINLWPPSIHYLQYLTCGKGWQQNYGKFNCGIDFTKSDVLKCSCWKKYVFFIFQFPNWDREFKIVQKVEQFLVVIRSAKETDHNVKSTRVLKVCWGPHNTQVRKVLATNKGKYIFWFNTLPSKSGL